LASGHGAERSDIPERGVREVIATTDPRTEGSRTRTARGALWLSVGSWGAKVTQTVVLLVLAKALAPAEFGILAIASLTYNILSSINELGVADALTYLQDRIEEATSTALSLVLAAGLVLMILTWALAPVIASFFHSPDSAFVIRGFAVCLPFDASAQVPIGRLTRSLSFRRRAVTDSLPSAIGALVTIAVVVSGYPLIGLVAGQIASSVANAAIAFLLGPRCLPGWSPVLARRLLNYGGYLGAASLINCGLLNVDYIIVGHVLGPVALGLYSLAYRICFMPYLAISVVANGAVFPYYCRLPSREAIGRASESTISLINALSIPWFAGLILFADHIVLLGAKWAPATGAVRFLAVYGFFLSLIFSALQVLKAVGRANLVFIGRGLHLATLTAVLVGTVHAGITIVALDQALVAAGIAVVTCLWTVRYASVRLLALCRSVGLPLLGVVGMISVVFLADLVPGLDAGSSWISLLIPGSLAMVVFAGVLLTVMPGLIQQGWATLRGREPQGEVTTSSVIRRNPSAYRSRQGTDPARNLSARETDGAHDVRLSRGWAMVPAAGSYRESHLGAAKARSYDEDLWDPRAAKGLDWLVEQRLLADILRSDRSLEPSSAADFACGTGRVLEFLGRYFPDSVGIDVSSDMLALARARCPQATLILGDVTTTPGLAPGPFDLITAFRFFLNAEPRLRSEALAWMRASLQPRGLVVANFHLNPASLRGMYLRLRMNPAERIPMMGIADARRLFADNGFTVRRILGYSYLPYRRDGRNLWGPGARRRAEMIMAGSKILQPVAGSFLMVATLKPSGSDD
jgi:O-antigen/teichoic acid export membrane protein/SAM-dependent methyltransferase